MSDQSAVVVGYLKGTDPEELFIPVLRGMFEGIAEITQHEITSGVGKGEWEVRIEPAKYRDEAAHAIKGMNALFAAISYKEGIEEDEWQELTDTIAGNIENAD